MLAQEKAGKATSAHKAWLAKWRAAGSPSTQAGMSAKPAPAKPSTAAADKAAAAKAAADRRKAAEAAAKKQQQEKIKAQEAAKAAAAKKAAKAAADKKAAQMAAAKKAAAEKKAAEIKRQKDQAQRLAAKAAADAKKAADAKAAAAKPQVSAWEKSKNHMVAQEKAGKATAAQKAWVQKWKAAGSPSTQEGMKKATATVKPTPPKPTPPKPTPPKPAPPKPASPVPASPKSAPQVSAWEKNKNHMVAQEEAGKATAAQKAWVQKWRAAGSPSTQEEMNKAAATVKPATDPAKGQPSGGGVGSFFNGIRNGSATNIKGNAPAGGTDAAVTVDQTGGNPSGMFNNLMGVVNNVRDPNTTEPIKFTQAEIDKELEDRAAAQAAADAAAAAAAQAAADQAQAGQFNPTQEAGPVRNRNFQTVNYGTQGGPTAGVNTGIGVAGPSQATPWADAYMRTQSLGGGQPIAGLPSGVMSDDNFPPPKTGGARPSGPMTGGARPSGPPSAPTFKPPVTVNDGGFAPSHQPSGGFKPNDDRGYGPQPGGGYIPDDTGFFNTENDKTPWADAFLRAEKAATKQGPISGLFSKEMENS
jgi:hypothetical protein